MKHRFILNSAPADAPEPRADVWHCVTCNANHGPAQCPAISGAVLAWDFTMFEYDDAGPRSILTEEKP